MTMTMTMTTVMTMTMLNKLPLKTTFVFFDLADVEVLLDRTCGADLALSAGCSSVNAGSRGGTDCVVNGFVAAAAPAIVDDGVAFDAVGNDVFGCSVGVDFLVFAVTNEVEDSSEEGFDMEDATDAEGARFGKPAAAVAAEVAAAVAAAAAAAAAEAFVDPDAGVDAGLVSSDFRLGGDPKEALLLVSESLPFDVSAQKDFLVVIIVSIVSVVGSSTKKADPRRDSRRLPANLPPAAPDALTPAPSSTDPPPLPPPPPLSPLPPPPLIIWW